MAKVISVLIIDWFTREIMHVSAHVCSDLHNVSIVAIYLIVSVGFDVKTFQQNIKYAFVCILVLGNTI